MHICYETCLARLRRWIGTERVEPTSPILSPGGTILMLDIVSPSDREAVAERPIFFGRCQ